MTITIVLSVGCQGVQYPGKDNLNLIRMRGILNQISLFLINIYSLAVLSVFSRDLENAGFFLCWTQYCVIDRSNLLQNLLRLKTGDSKLPLAITARNKAQATELWPPLQVQEVWLCRALSPGEPRGLSNLAEFCSPCGLCGIARN